MSLRVYDYAEGRASGLCIEGCEECEMKNLTNFEIEKYKIKNIRRTLMISYTSIMNIYNIGGVHAL